jgi:hypothetical protein
VRGGGGGRGGGTHLQGCRRWVHLGRRGLLRSPSTPPRLRPAPPRSKLRVLQSQLHVATYTSESAPALRGIAAAIDAEEAAARAAIEQVRRSCSHCAAGARTPQAAFGEPRVLGRLSLPSRPAHPAPLPQVSAQLLAYQECGPEFGDIVWQYSQVKVRAHGAPFLGSLEPLGAPDAGAGLPARAPRHSRSLTVPGPGLAFAAHPPPGGAAQGGARAAPLQPAGDGDGADGALSRRR